MNISKIKRSSQSIDNFSFDEEYLQSAVEVLVENPEGTALVRQKAIATEAKQDELLSLTETLQELSARLSILASMANAGQPALRIIPISLPTLASVTTVDTVTTLGTLTNFGTGVPAREVARATNNATAILSNINNVTT